MTIQELQDKVNRLHTLLNDPQEGLFSWNLAVGNAMNDLVNGWLNQNPKTLTSIPEEGV